MSFDFTRPMEIDGVIYTDIVPRNYKLNPATDDLVYGDDLVNGMRVLIGRTTGRYDEGQPELHNAGLPINNRWCVVSRVRVTDDTVFFIGVYEDGHKERRSSALVDIWLVKKWTMPKQEEEPAGDESATTPEN